MGKLSIITPIYSPVPEQLMEAYDSIREQELPEGWEWEWVVQEDGHTAQAKDTIPDAPQVKIAAGRRAGVAITRNLALARSEGDLVKNLDQDDVLAPGVLGRDIDVLTANPHFQWTTSRALDLLPDGSRVGLEDDPPAGPLEPGFVVDHWISHDYRLPVHPTTICIRRGFAIAMGGWLSVPGSDDTGLLTAASAVSTGYFHGEVGLYYRKWPGQQSARAEHVDPVEWGLRMGLIRERAEYLAAIWPKAG